ncbi:MAG: FAD:protein FMN transferase [Gammaproteobacteria bacterium]|nr:FAD:protein FMN transferase [Gammaproteobacteria bacterium]
MLLLLVASSGRAEWFQEGQNKMGTRVFVKLWHEDANKASELLAVSMAEIDRIETSMSTYHTQSEISRVNAEAAESWVLVGHELFDLIRRSLSLSEQTGGAFDITYDSIGQFYDFNKRARPSPEQVAVGLVAVDYRHVQLDSDKSAAHFSHSGVRINLGGIAKGYAIEGVIGLLRDAGVRHALANAGGDTRVLGDRIGLPWVVGIRDPDDEMSIVTRLEIEDVAISTSGDYEQFFMEEGVRYHHIINPSTGSSAGALRSVTIIGPDATLTDGLSTSVFVMGLDAGMRLIESIPKYSAIIIDENKNAHFSSGVN